MSTKARLSIFVFGLTAVIAGLAWFFVQGQKEPEYNGRPLSYWLNELPRRDPILSADIKAMLAPTLPAGTTVSFSFPTGPITYFGKVYGSSNSLELKAAAAIRSLGTNCIPFLLQKFRAYDVQPKRFVMEHLNKMRRGQWLPGKSHDPSRWQAITAFELLGTNAAPAIPEIRVLSTNSNRVISTSAKIVLDHYEMALQQSASDQMTLP
jgi:hypothetical protein